MDPLPFEAESFDVVHSRFVLQHLPMPNDVLEGLNQLVKPSGWLLLEDADAPKASSEHAQAVLETVSRNRDFRLLKGLSINAASGLEPRVRALGSYDTVNVHKVLVPVNTPDPVEDKKIARLAQQFRISTYWFITDPVNEHAPKSWLTPQLQQAFKDEFDTLSWTITLSVFWVWAQKRA
ncbi:hypothetical protein EWM64_g7137 [Hericium alpestre]|uniref:Methyltransferase type 11 domain-containing protein n=1 Tax=Hericium alpestre TaxID=135208 RepID=A0A4Y9ZPP6_9AGAM|nr:hypothetical protein EWM64_g7137 [Hericium alpestre]